MSSVNEGLVDDLLEYLATGAWGSVIERSETMAWCMLRRGDVDERGDAVPVAMVSVDYRVDPGEREMRGQIYRDGRWVGPDGSHTDGFPIYDVLDLDRLIALYDKNGTLSSREWQQGLPGGEPQYVVCHDAISPTRDVHTEASLRAYLDEMDDPDRGWVGIALDVRGDGIWAYFRWGWERIAQPLAEARVITYEAAARIAAQMRDLQGGPLSGRVVFARDDGTVGNETYSAEEWPDYDPLFQLPLRIRFAGDEPDTAAELAACWGYV